MNSGAEVKVGVVVLAALVVLFLVLYYFIGVFAAERGYVLDVVFERADIRGGDAVSMAGVQIGRVESVRLTADNRALVRLRIQREVAIRRGYHISIVPGVLLGENYVAIEPVAGRRAGPALRPGARVAGASSVGMKELVSQTQTLLSELRDTVHEVTALIRDQKLRQLVEQSVGGLAEAAKSLTQLAQSLSTMAVETRPKLAGVMVNMEGVTNDLRTTSQVLAKAASESEAPAQLEEAARRLRSIVEKVDAIAAEFQKLAADPEMKGLMHASLGNLSDASDQIRKASEDIRLAAASFQEGARDVPGITANAREATANLRDASVEIKDMTHQAHTGLSKFTGRAAGAVKVITGLPEVRPSLNLGSEYLAHDRRWWLDANVELRRRGNLLRLGVADIGETDRFNLQLGQALGPGTLRWGLVQSDVGVGYDWPATPWLTLSAEAYDHNEPRVNLFGYWSLGGGLHDWSLVTGYRALGADGNVAIGIRAQR